MPVGALASIGHRVSGLVLAIGMPAAVYFLAQSLRSEDEFNRVRALGGLLPAKFAAVLLAWALAHHLFAGVRHMLTDIGIGSPLHTARRTAYLVNYGAFAAAVLTAGLVW